MTTYHEKFLGRIVQPNLSVNSGVYSAIDERITMKLNERGEYEYIGLEESSPLCSEALLQVSAFGEEAPDEYEITASLYANEPGVNFNEIAGFYNGVFAGWAVEDEIRLNASSGGITTWLLLELMRTGVIDGVIHMRPGEKGGGLFEYQVSRTEKEVREGAKSRYYPGELSEVLKEIRLREGRYALVAIPSIVYEVRLLQRLHPEYSTRIKVIVGLICGHQKTANYSEYLGWRMGVEPGSLESIDFRKKIEGLPANSYSTEIRGIIDGRMQTRVATQDQLLGTDWGLGFFKSKFSDFTEDALNECADIVIGDAWLPKYIQDSRGTNIVLTRSQALRSVLENGLKRGELYLEKLTIDDFLTSQSSLVRQNVEEIGYRLSYLKKRGYQTPKRSRRNASLKLSYLRKATQRARMKTSVESHLAYLRAKNHGDLELFDNTMEPLVKYYRGIQKLAKVKKKIARRCIQLFDMKVASKQKNKI